MMVGQRTVTKPSRSDEVVDAEEQLKIADQIRAKFDSAAPKRPTKPNRSEPDSKTQNPLDYSTVDQLNIPELDKFRSLQSQPPVIISSMEGGAATAHDEFVDTEYYKELNSVDKEHHRTGTGFIRVATEGGGEFDVFDFGSPERHDGMVGLMKIRSNPATNDWVPRAHEDEVFMMSSKPNRSESS